MWPVGELGAHSKSGEDIAPSNVQGSSATSAHTARFEVNVGRAVSKREQMHRHWHQRYCHTAGDGQEMIVSANSTMLTVHACWYVYLLFNGNMCQFVTSLVFLCSLALIAVARAALSLSPVLALQFELLYVPHSPPSSL